MGVELEIEIAGGIMIERHDQRLLVLDVDYRPG